MTVSTSIDAPPDVVLRFVADAENLRHWAPAAAHLRLDIRVSHDAGTVDFLASDAPANRPFGAYSRVVQNGNGCEYLFTRFLPRGLSQADEARERAVLVQELETVREMCEGKELVPARISKGSGPAPPSTKATPC
jgi:hypothetical protein